MKNYKELVKREMAKYDIAAVTVLEPGVHFGNYGLVASNWGRWLRAKAKYVYKILRTLQNSHYSKRWENIDGHYYYVPDNHKVLEFNGNIFIKLCNSQIFDVTNQYWFHIRESKLLLEELEKGYDYSDPVNFFDDHESILGYRGSMAE